METEGADRQTEVGGGDREEGGGREEDEEAGTGTFKYIYCSVLMPGMTVLKLL